MALLKESVLHLGEVGRVRAHLEKMANILYPDNGIEWFSDALEDWATESRGVSLKGDVVIKPESFCRATPMVSISTGSSEGLMLHCGLMYFDAAAAKGGRTESRFSLFARAKLFGPAEEAWGIARALQREAENIFNDQAMSTLPEMFAKLPRSHSYLRHVDLRGDIKIRMSRDEQGFQVDVIHPVGVDLLDSKRFDLAGIVPAPYEIHAEVIAESKAIQFAGAWGFLLSRQKDCRPAFDQALAAALSNEMRRDPGWYGVEFKPKDFVANPAVPLAKPKSRRSELGLG